MKRALFAALLLAAIAGFAWTLRRFSRLIFAGKPQDLSDRTGQRVAQDQRQGERREQPLDQRLARPHGDDDEAPEDQEVVTAADGGHQPLGPGRGDGGLLDDLLLAEEVGHH